MVPTVSLVIIPPGLITTECIFNNPSHCVYFLQSCSTSRTYVGYSIDPFHRLDQHNGYIVGGAKKTKIGRPWRIVCIVSGFPTANAALQFEWRWHAIRKKRTRHGRKTKKGLNIQDCAAGLTYLFACRWTTTSPNPHSFMLTVWWNRMTTFPDRISPSTLKYRHQPFYDRCPSWDVYSGIFC